MNNNSGCTWVGALVAGIVLFAALAFGAPDVSSIGLSWDNSATIAREAQRTERARIEARRDTELGAQRTEAVQGLAVVLAIVGSLAVAGWSVQRSVTAWAARPHRPAPPPQVVMLAAPYLAQMEDARMDYDAKAGAWVVYSPKSETVKYLTG